MSAGCQPPILIERVLDDPGLVRRLVEANGPYSPVQRYFQNEAEYRASSGKSTAERPMIIAPNFRGDWAYEAPQIEGVEPIFRHEGFRAAAARLFGSECVVPFSVYSNITWQLPFDQGGGHNDIPEFRGVNRTRYPTWLLSMMGHSRLFEDERVEIATVVSWFYEGADGGFTYWPDGPDAPPKVHEGAICNTAIAGDNDRMYHRVRPVGDRAAGLPRGLSLDTLLVHRGDGRWEIVDGDRVLGRCAWQDLRVSVSWKAWVFADAEEERRYRDHSDDLCIDDVWERFYADLAARGERFEPPADPLRDPGLVDLLSRVYVREPSVFESSAPAA